MRITLNHLNVCIFNHGRNFSFTICFVITSIKCGKVHCVMQAIKNKMHPNLKLFFG